MEEVAITGFVMPVGNGAVGKTSLAKMLDITTLNPDEDHPIINLPKTKNLEFEFIPVVLAGRGKKYRIMLQMLVPPGQRHKEGDRTSRSFDEVIDIYRFHIRRLDLVILTYKLNDRETFFDLEEWVNMVLSLCSPKTNFVLLGTHLDLSTDREITPEEIDNGVAYLRAKITEESAGWQGMIQRYEISNLTGENIRDLKRYLGYSVLVSQGALAP